MLCVQRRTTHTCVPWVSSESFQQELSRRECGLEVELLPGWYEALYPASVVVGTATLTAGYHLPGPYFSNSHSLSQKKKKKVQNKENTPKTYMKDSNSSPPLIMDFVK